MKCFLLGGEESPPQIGRGGIGDSFYFFFFFFIRAFLMKRPLLGIVGEGPVSRADGGESGICFLGLVLYFWYAIPGFT
jgi:hypothetical protein